MLFGISFLRKSFLRVDNPVMTGTYARSKKLKSATHFSFQFTLYCLIQGRSQPENYDMAQILKGILDDFIKNVIN